MTERPSADALLSKPPRKPLAFRKAISSLAGADYELAVAVAQLARAGETDLVTEADALFGQVLAFRQKLEARDA